MGQMVNCKQALRASNGAQSTAGELVLAPIPQLLIARFSIRGEPANRSAVWASD